MTTAAKPVRRRTTRKTSNDTRYYVTLAYRLVMTAMVLAAIIVLHG